RLGTAGDSGSHPALDQWLRCGLETIRLQSEHALRHADRRGQCIHGSVPARSQGARAARHGPDEGADQGGDWWREWRSGECAGSEGPHSEERAASGEDAARAGGFAEARSHARSTDEAQQHRERLQQADRLCGEHGRADSRRSWAATRSRRARPETAEGEPRRERGAATGGEGRAERVEGGAVGEGAGKDSFAAVGAGAAAGAAEGVVADCGTAAALRKLTATANAPELSL